MNTRKLFPLLLLILLLASTAGCKANQATPEPTLAPVQLPTNPPVLRPPVATPTPVASPTPSAPSPTPVAPAVKTAQDYFAALQNSDSKGAASYFSNFSLMVDEITRGDATSAIQAQIAAGTKWSDLEVVESKPFDDRTTLVHVRYSESQKNAAEPAPTATAGNGKTAVSTATAAATAEATAELTTTASAPDTKAVPKDEWWAVRQEAGQWRINRGNLIDYQTLTIKEQTTGGLTMRPRQMARYTDHLRLTLLAQNQTNDPIVLGQTNEVLATFQFGDQSIEAAPTRLIFDRLRSYPNTVIDVPGLFDKYPDGVVIRKWKNTQEKPWFTFDFNS